MKKFYFLISIFIFMNLFAGCAAEKPHDGFTLSNFVTGWIKANYCILKRFVSGVLDTIISPFVYVLQAIVDIFYFLR